MTGKNYYQTLGVPRGASQDDIKKAYRKLAMQYHPDRNLGKEKWANDRFKEINEAFSVLGDPDKRRQYDQFGEMGNAGDVYGNPTTRNTFEDLIKDFNGSGLGYGFLDEVFAEYLKGRGVSFRDYGTEQGATLNREDFYRRARPSPPQDVRYELTLSRAQAARGFERDLLRGGKTLRVKIPAGVSSGNQVRLHNARMATDGQPGDIVIVVRVG